MGRELRELRVTLRVGFGRLVTQLVRMPALGYTRRLERLRALKNANGLSVCIKPAVEKEVIPQSVYFLLGQVGYFPGEFAESIGEEIDDMLRRGKGETGSSLALFCSTR